MLHASGLHALPNVVSRPYAGSDDFWRVRTLLVETYPITPTGFNWEIRRWDGWNTHRETPDAHPCVQLWETDAGKLVGVAHPESEGAAFFEIHPDFRALEAEMLSWSEAHLAVSTDDGGRRRLDMFVFDYDTLRRRLLEQRGYSKTPYSGVTRRLRFGNLPLPEVVMAEGYTLRSTCRDDADDQRVADVLNAGFNRTMHTAREFYHFTTHSPSYRHELNLVAEAEDGSFAALVGITYDEANQRGVFEPVCTHPHHRRKGLARALMFEGLHRLKALGALDVYVDTGDAIPANELYDAVGFTEAYKGYIWRRMFA